MTTWSRRLGIPILLLFVVLIMVGVLPTSTGVIALLCISLTLMVIALTGD